LESETAKGSQAQAPKLERWLTNLKKLAPDIYDLTMVTLIDSPATPSPVQVIARIIRAEKLDGSPAARLNTISEQLKASGLAQEEQQRLEEQLGILRDEVARGEQGDVGQIRASLDAFATALPDSRHALWQWLEAIPDVYPPVRIIARRILAV
jgi:hypothetical protein